jgi:hypothetical protein
MSESRQGNVDFLVAGRLLDAYQASIVDLGLMTQIAEKHLAEHGAAQLNASNVPVILADFERLRKKATRLNVPMPEPAGLLREIDLRIVPSERHFQAAFRELVADRVGRLDFQSGSTTGALRNEKKLYSEGAL